MESLKKNLLCYWWKCCPWLMGCISTACGFSAHSQLSLGAWLLCKGFSAIPNQPVCPVTLAVCSNPWSTRMGLGYPGDNFLPSLLLCNLTASKLGRSSCSSQLLKTTSDASRSLRYWLLFWESRHRAWLSQHFLLLACFLQLSAGNPHSVPLSPSPCPQGQRAPICPGWSLPPQAAPSMFHAPPALEAADSRLFALLVCLCLWRADPSLRRKRGWTWRASSCSDSDALKRGTLKSCFLVRFHLFCSLDGFLGSEKVRGPLFATHLHACPSVTATQTLLIKIVPDTSVWPT